MVEREADFHVKAYRESAIQTAMLAKLPHQVLREAVITHLTMAEGFGPLLTNVPAR
jgi:hypothetical protein